MNKDPKRFERVPYFENPAWFTKPVVDERRQGIKTCSKTFIMLSGNRNAGENHVFMLEDEVQAHGSETTVIFEPTQTFLFVIRGKSRE